MVIQYNCLSLSIIKNNTMKNTIKTTFRNLILLAILLGLSNIVNAQRLIDTNEKYASSVYIGQGENDCSVRALASLNNIKYYKAHSILKNLGRENNQGFDVRIFLQYLKGLGQFDKMTPSIADKNITTRKLVNAYVLNKDKDYLVMSKDHIFTLKYNGTYWVTYGNYNDLDNIIIHLITINKLK